MTIFFILILALIPVTNYLTESNLFNLSLFHGERLTSLTLNTRLVIWKNAIEAFSKEPLLGIGFNNFPIFNQIKSGMNQYPHQTYFGILAEMGILGFILFFLIYFEIFRSIKLLPKVFLLFQVFYLVSGLSEGFTFLTSLVVSFPLAVSLAENIKNNTILFKRDFTIEGLKIPNPTRS